VIAWIAIVVALSAGFVTGEGLATPPTAEVVARRERHPLSEQVLKAALDSEALFTLSGGLKPISAGFITLLTIGHHEHPNVRRLGEALEVLNTRVTEAFIHSIGPFPDGITYHLATVVHREAYRRKVREYQSFFESLDIAPHSSSQEALRTIERSRRQDRFRGYGLLFGYPAEAVNFFVAADEEEQRTGRFVTRDSIELSTDGGDHFVWVVPVGHRPSPLERAVMAEAAHILDRYRRLRAEVARSRTIDYFSIFESLSEGRDPLAPCSEALYQAALSGVSSAS
jgi:hypothetical protein